MGGQKQVEVREFGGQRANMGQKKVDAKKGCKVETQEQSEMHREKEGQSQTSKKPHRNQP